jgi:hypothetical protein
VARRRVRWPGIWRGGGKGIDIVGPRNAPVKAVAPGKVVYSGSGLRGYGKLLIVKHAGEFLSAYAHNESILVKEGDNVNAGQKIALMGDSDADRVTAFRNSPLWQTARSPTYLPSAMSTDPSDDSNDLTPTKLSRAAGKDTSELA